MPDVTVIINGEPRVVSEEDAARLQALPVDVRRETAAGAVKRGRKTLRRKVAEKQKIAGGLEAIGRGVSGGALDVAATKLFGVDPEEIAARKEAMGGLGTALEVGGLLGTSFLGSGLLAGGSRLAQASRFTPVGATSFLARKTGEKVATKLGGGALAVGTGLVAEGAIEGSIYGASKAASDLVLQDKEITAEAVVGGALAGGAFGAAGGAFGGVLSAAGRRLAKPKAIKIPDEQVKGFQKTFQSHLDEVDEIARGAKAASAADPMSTDVLRQRIIEQMGGQGKKTEAARDLLDELRTARKSLDGLDGGFSAETFTKAVLSGNVEKATGAAIAYQKYIDAATEILPAGPTREAFERSVESLGENLKGLVTAANPGAATAFDRSVGWVELLGGTEIATDLVGIDIIPDGSMADTALKAATLMAFAKGEMGGGSKLRGILESFFQSGTAGAGAQLLGRTARSAGLGPVGMGFARNVGFTGGRQFGKAVTPKATRGAAQAMDADISQLVSAQNRSRSRIGGIFTNMGKAGPRAASKIRVKEVLEEVLGPDPEPAPRVQSKPETFKRKIKAFNDLMGNEQKFLTRMHEMTQGLMLLDPELGQLAQQQMAAKLQFLHSKLPQDPGTQNGLFGSSWLPDEFAIDQWLRYYEATVDPPSTVELFSAGRLTPQAAEALKETSPAHFRQIQMELMRNPQRLQKLTYSQRVQLGYLFETPTDPMLNITNALQANHGEEATQGEQQPMTMPPAQPGGKTINQPSHVQQLTQE